MTGLSLSHVSYVYGKDTPFYKEALSDITLSFVPGIVTGIIGQTGSGKSTLLELLCGLLAPTSGQVFLDGEDINRSVVDMTCDRMKEKGFHGDSPFWLSFAHHSAWRASKQDAQAVKRQLHARVGLVMQYPEYQLFDETVLSDIAYGPRNMGKSKEEAEACAAEAAALFGVSPDWFSRSPFDLSGGEKRRVAIAGVLAMHPDILILDEPAAGLDPVGRKIIFEGIANYNRNTGATVIFVSHSMEDLAQYCRQVVVMHEGRIAGQGTPDEIFARADDLRQMGLDIPQVTYIAQELVRQGIPLSGDLSTLDGVKRAILAYWEGRERS